MEDVGYKEILEAANTQKALDIVNVLEQQREEPHLDLLICDIRLDGSENGIRLVERLAERKWFLGTRVVFVSGMVDPYISEIDLLRAGGLSIETLKKPFDIDDLLKIV